MRLMQALCVRFDVKRQTEDGSAQYAYLFSTEFDENAPTA